MKPSSRLPVLVLLVAAVSLAAAVRAPAQAVQREGLQAEASFRATTLLGGAFPYDETGPGFHAGVRHLWPSGISLALGGSYAEPVDLDRGGDLRQRILREQRYYAEVRYQVQGSRVVQPYAAGRAGWELLESRSVPEADGSGGVGEVVLGTEIWASDRIGFRVDAASSSFRLSGFLPDRTTAGQTWSLEAGVQFFFGTTTRDGDGDGVGDGRDACPGTPGGMEVDDSGCLPDGDGDGRPDVRDACPDTPSGVQVDGRGCALDGDGDGVPDSLDECPGTPAGQPVDEEGCVADADADGVADDVDACPDTPAGNEVDASGCTPDADDDGVPDGRDRCPGTMRGVGTDYGGCSDVQAGVRQGRLAVDGLPFRFRDVQVNMDFAGQLEQIGRELLRDPDLGLEIRVFTDTIGPTSYNQQMSQRLAEAARDFLLRNYPELERSRLEAVGMGEADPRDAAAEGSGSRVVFLVLPRGGGDAR